MKIFAIIPAGGKGTRSGFSIPKQYIKINGKELIVYTLEVFQKNKTLKVQLYTFYNQKQTPLKL